MTSKLQFEDVRGKHLLIGLSGGADSVALLCMLHEQQDQLCLRLTAAHFHHGIRGDAADADALFCRTLCRKLGVAYLEGRADVPAIAHRTGVGIETAARNERRRFLKDSMMQCGADCIALAHHMDDQAETVLMHLFRGAGMAGVAGMRRMDDCFYRPLLDMRKSFLMKYLEERCISWREDASNGIPDNPRNALRLHVLPEIEKSYPRACEAIARHAGIARTESDYLDRIADSFLSGRLERGLYGLRLQLDGLDAALEAPILRRALRRILPDGLNAAKLDELAALCALHRGRLDVTGACAAEKTPSALYLLRKNPGLPAAVPLVLPGETILPGICRIRAELGDFDIEPGNPASEMLDAELLEGAMLRTRRQGDRFHPLGAPGDRLLSDVLTDKKMDRPLRDCMPLIAKDNRILWTAGAGIAQEASIQSKTLRKVRITLYKHTDEQTEVYQ